MYTGRVGIIASILLFISIEISYRGYGKNELNLKEAEAIQAYKAGVSDIKPKKGIYKSTKYKIFGYLNIVIMRISLIYIISSFSRKILLIILLLFLCLDKLFFRTKNTP